MKAIENFLNQTVSLGVQKGPLHKFLYSFDESDHPKSTIGITVSSGSTVKKPATEKTENLPELAEDTLILLCHYYLNNLEGIKRSS